MNVRHAYTDVPHTERTDLKNLARILPFITAYRGRASLALACLIASKVAIVSVPLVLKQLIDYLSQSGSYPHIVPIVLLGAYGLLRFASSLFNELRDVLFARVRYRVMHQLSVKVLEHLHRLSLRFHLERKTGNVTRDLDRGTQSISSILNYLIFNIIPTLIEFALVTLILVSQYNTEYFLVAIAAVSLYVGFTLLVANWRMHFRHLMNRLDSDASGRAVDSLLNYETVKYFDNEDAERDSYNEFLSEWVEAGVKSQSSMSLLNFGQATIVSFAVVVMMFLAVADVADGSLTIGDLVLINALMLQMFMPLSILGIVYRQLHYALADMDLVFKLLDRVPEILDKNGAKPIVVSSGWVRFESVNFFYDDQRQILHNVSFEIPPGHKVAVVGPSGAGKSTLLRLLFRFYDVSSGAILIDGQNIKDHTQQSLRQSIGVVPQDTVLFNDTIAYNLQYANAEASEADLVAATRTAGIHDFIAGLPDGFQTRVGERGLKLSGGEKQRMAIARVVLKNPPVIVFDEATSSLDSKSEKLILGALASASENTSSLMIAHRLSTITDANQILVMDQGRIVERGSHEELLRTGGLYSQMWAIQEQRNSE